MPIIEISDEQIELHNRLIDLCKTMVDTDRDKRDEVVARIKSMVYGKHISEDGLYWPGANMMP